MLAIRPATFPRSSFLRSESWKTHSQNFGDCLGLYFGCTKITPNNNRNMSKSIFNILIFKTWESGNLNIVGHVRSAKFEKTKETLTLRIRFLECTKSKTSKLRNYEHQAFWNFGKRWGPDKYEDPPNEFLKILDMGSISSRKHEYLENGLHFPLGWFTSSAWVVCIFRSPLNIPTRTPAPAPLCKQSTQSSMCSVYCFIPCIVVEVRWSLYALCCMYTHNEKNSRYGSSMREESKRFVLHFRYNYLLVSVN